MKKGLHDTTHQAVKNTDLWKKGQQTNETYHCPSMLFRRLFRSQYREESRYRLANYVKWENKAEILGRTRQPEFPGRGTREERESQREILFWRGSILSIQLSSDQQSHVRKLPKTRGKITKKDRDNIPQHSYGRRDHICSH